MLPTTQYIISDGVEIVPAMLVTIIVVVMGGETISRVFAVAVVEDEAKWVIMGVLPHPVPIHRHKVAPLH